MAAESAAMVARVLTVGTMSAVLPGLKGNSLTQPLADPLACEEALHAGASCTPCVSKFKLCRGHFSYEPFTVVLFEAFATVCIGILATIFSYGGEAQGLLLDWSSLKQVAPIGATYALGDVLDLMAASRCSATTLIVASQLRLPLCALLRQFLLRRGQTLKQWLCLTFITLLCVAHVAWDLQDSVDMSSGLLDLLETLPLILGKCVISCLGAVHAEHFLQHGTVKKLPLAATQVHFKAATAVGAIAIGYLQGNNRSRILSNVWDGSLFHTLPMDVKVGDARTPFFGGWNVRTWVLVSCLISNNFLVGDQLRRMSSVAKYIAYAFGLAASHCLVLFSEHQHTSVAHMCCCAGIAVLAVIYVQLPGPPAPIAAKKVE
eukprot:CAMPEP_0206501014 /NCGR_PEP_ID=MMETSP0324_2-20121206/52997_1 /ASSEMBLY_ACC=CAM_ASM_000836 /TAXON_ID=2866 /ORGANISM="Crypthecodinium cohnii, Strain Seligo" /LENGTH=374 /DNA_ID=CAMNT_0053988631 /DNA_START=117 /DNA_END=1241 /DNA_ORIENTATION=-